jgi:hypothetical protein
MQAIGNTTNTIGNPLMLRTLPGRNTRLSYAPLNAAPAAFGFSQDVQ